MRVPSFFRPVIRYVTPLFILVVFLAALIKPAGDWGDALRGLFSGAGYRLAADSVIGKLMHAGVEGYAWFDAQGRGTGFLVQDLTRLLLVALFAGLAFLVWKAWRLKDRTTA
jgi:neurotransmitter:Na+ symporter, NSS family